MNEKLPLDVWTYNYFTEPFEDKFMNVSIERDGTIMITQSNSEITRIKHKCSLKNLSRMFESLLWVTNQFQGLEEENATE